jgi:hypothetical protein
MGDAGQETEEWYRPERVPLPEALQRKGMGLADIDIPRRASCRGLDRPVHRTLHNPVVILPLHNWGKRDVAPEVDSDGRQRRFVQGLFRMLSILNTEDSRHQARHVGP